MTLEALYQRWQDAGRASWVGPYLDSAQRVPKLVTVFRVQRAAAPDGLAWSRSVFIAHAAGTRESAVRRALAPDGVFQPALFQAVVPGSAVLAWWRQRGADELVVDPTVRFDRKTLWVGRKADAWPVPEDIETSWSGALAHADADDPYLAAVAGRHPVRKALIHSLVTDLAGLRSSTAR